MADYDLDRYNLMEDHSNCGNVVAVYQQTRMKVET